MQQYQHMHDLVKVQYEIIIFVFLNDSHDLVKNNIKAYIIKCQQFPKFNDLVNIYKKPS